MATRTPRPSRSSAGTSTDGPPAKKRKTEEQNDARNHGNRASPNHSGGATNPNTPVFPYLSKAQVRGNCDEENKAIKKNCDKKDGKNKSQKAVDNAQLDKTSKLSTISEKVKDVVTKLDTVGKSINGYTPATKTGANAWLDDHCSGLWVKPGGGSNIDRFKAQLEAVKQEYQKDAATLLKQLGAKVVEKAEDKLIAYGEQTAAEEGAALVSLVIPGVGEAVEIGTQIWAAVSGVVTTVTTAYDAAKTIVTDGPKVYEQAKSLLAQADDIQKIIKGPGINDLMADMMTAIAEANPCVRARKCSLVPYGETKTAEGQAASGKGCCPGQTGHHVLPDAMFRDPDAKNAETDIVDGEASGGSGRDAQKTLRCWDHYKCDDAPTICLEGHMANAGNGSHGAFHEATEKLIAPIRKDANRMKYTTARDEVANIMNLAYGCSKKCIQAQLDAYYKDADSCHNLQNAEVVPHSGRSRGGPKPDIGAPKRR